MAITTDKNTEATMDITKFNLLPVYICESK